MKSQPLCLPGDKAQNSQICLLDSPSTPPVLQEAVVFGFTAIFREKGLLTPACYDKTLAKCNMPNVSLFVLKSSQRNAIPHLGLKLPFLLLEFLALLWYQPKSQGTGNSNISSTTNSTNIYRLPNSCQAPCKALETQSCTRPERPQ